MWHRWQILMCMVHPEIQDGGHNPKLIVFVLAASSGHSIIKVENNNKLTSIPTLLSGCMPALKTTYQPDREGDCSKPEVLVSHNLYMPFRHIIVPGEDFGSSTQYLQMFIQHSKEYTMYCNLCFQQHASKSAETTKSYWRQSLGENFSPLYYRLQKFWTIYRSQVNNSLYVWSFIPNS